MEDVIALRTTLASGERRYFLTWGRIFDRVDPNPMLDVISPGLSQFDLGNPVQAVELCSSLTEAASEPYFYECLFTMGQEKIPFGAGYENWRLSKRERMVHGKELWYLGRSPSKQE